MQLFIYLLVVEFGFQVFDDGDGFFVGCVDECECEWVKCQVVEMVVVF